MTEERSIAAVILAGGRSSRMGALKPLLPFGPATVLETIIITLQEAGVSDIRVVIGYRGSDLIPLLERLGVPSIVNPETGSPMFDSVRLGVSSLGKHITGFFIFPADMPAVRTDTLAALIGTFKKRNGGIVYPCYDGRRGHPPLISAACIPAILSEYPPGGLRSLLAQYEGDALNMECDDPGVLMDIDSPEDYEKILTRMMNH